MLEKTPLQSWVEAWEPETEMGFLCPKSPSVPISGDLYAAECLAKPDKFSGALVTFDYFTYQEEYGEVNLELL